MPSKSAKKKIVPETAVTAEVAVTATATATTADPIGHGPTIRTPEQDRQALREKVRMFYDIQRLRMQTAGRSDHDADGDDIVLHPNDLAIVTARCKDLKSFEAACGKAVALHLQGMPFYAKVLSDKTRYKGIGPAMAGMMLSEFDINKADTVSKFWSFAGLCPVNIHRCKSCQEPLDLVESVSNSEVTMGNETYTHRKRTAKPVRVSAPGSTDKPEKPEPKRLTCAYGNVVLREDQTFASGEAMRPKKGEKLKYNAFLKTKMVGVMGSVLIKLNTPFRKFYDEYKHRKQTVRWGMSDGHRHNAAVRYMVKHVLQQLWIDWRTFEGLEVRKSYHEEYQGHMHKGPPVVPALDMNALGAQSMQDMEIQAEIDSLEE